jgi:hypothetical protein
MIANIDLLAGDTLSGRPKIPRRVIGSARTRHVFGVNHAELPPVEAAQRVGHEASG